MGVVSEWRDAPARGREELPLRRGPQPPRPLEEGAPGRQRRHPRQRTEPGKECWMYIRMVY